MTLSEKQRLFASLLGKLLGHIYAEGYEVAMGEVYRHPDWAKEMQKQGKGIANSLHCQSLAADLNLFLDGVYLTKSEDHAKFGEYWESLSGEGWTCCWGGRFGDGNHYSIEHGGRK